MKEKELDQIWVIDKNWELEKLGQKTEIIDTLWMKPDFDAAERTIDVSQLWEFPKEFTFKWYDFILHKNVFSPIHFKWSSIYIDHLPIGENGSLLDMWCGCGVIWITSFLKYHLDRVVCADVNPYAVENTKENISKHNISDHVVAIQSDVFSDIDSNEKFDLIFWNAPYFDWEFDEKNILYRSMYDKNYEHIKRFILEWKKYLKEGWKIMIWFSSDKFPLEYARKLVNEIWYDLEIFYQEVDSLWFKQEILNVVKKGENKN
jgi:release factor glutamine methyltransferase